MTERRVVAEGWGHQGNGSVFCADSSLRFIYETHQAPQHPSAAAITSLAAANAPHAHHHVTKQGQPQQSQQPHGTFFMDQLKGANAYYPPTSDTKTAGGVFAGKRPRERSIDAAARADGVDLHEAEVARACSAITKHVPSLPHSFRECSVCLTANAYAQIRACGHTFHPQCFLRWFRGNRSCPLCRGPVDAVQLASVVSVQDELEAIMAEIDDEPLDVDASRSLGDPMLESPELLSFLASDFDTDMAALADLADDADMEDVDMAMPLPAAAAATVTPMKLETAPNASVAPPMQFAPTSTMPNYWNVLNQGLSAMPLVAPPPLAPTPPPVSAPTRMVHIAPKPDALGRASTAALHKPVASAMAPSARVSPLPQAATAALVVPTASASAAAASAPPRTVSCRCTGGCRNGRCACVKEGGMCGVACRCTSCKNPFLMVKAAGADIDALLTDACFMHNVSKTRDMVVRLQEQVVVPCCSTHVSVLECVQGYACSACARTFDFSWCLNRLLDHEKTPRNHCAICKRCCDHRDVHCRDCGRCYFAGVAASLPCPCKEATHHKKRREQQHVANATTPSRLEKAADDDENEADGECCIM